MYTRNVDRANPGCIIFLVDQSFSMTEGIGGSKRAKCQVVESTINRFLNELVIICERGEEKPRHYFDVGLLGYTTNVDGTAAVIRTFTPAALASQEMATIVELYDHQDFSVPLDETGAPSAGIPVWYQTPAPDTMRGTPICQVFERCCDIAGRWCAQHPTSFPPIVLHLTDGEGTDGNSEPWAEQLKAIGTRDGNVLLFNCHLSASAAPSIVFPDDERALSDDYARMLFRMSSKMPDRMRETAAAKNVQLSAGARAMAFNADATQLFHLINVGTQVLARPPHLR